MKQYRICASDKLCELKQGKRCGLGLGSSCEFQGATVKIFNTKKQALKQVVREIR